MARSTATIGVVLALLLVLSSCRPIDQVQETQEGRAWGTESALETESIPFKAAIPRGYGRFVGVLQSPGRNTRAILWFEKPDSTIAAVWVDYTKGVNEEVLLIPRK